MDGGSGLQSAGQAEAGCRSERVAKRNGTRELPQPSPDKFAAFAAFALNERDDVSERRAGREYFAHAQTFEFVSILGRNGAAAEKDDVLRVLRFELLHDKRKERHVRAAENREANAVGIFLNRGLYDLFGRL